MDSEKKLKIGFLIAGFFKKKKCFFRTDPPAGDDLQASIYTQKQGVESTEGSKTCSNFAGNGWLVSFFWGNLLQSHAYSSC